MTNEQLEKAARHLCMLNGVDPDEKVRDKHSHYDYCGYVKQWENWAYLVTQHIQVQQAIQEACVTVPPIADTTKLVCDVLHYCMFKNQKTQELTAKELKTLLSSLFDDKDIEDAVQYMTTEAIIVKTG